MTGIPFIDSFMTTYALPLGAGFGALQAIAQFLMLVLPQNTIAWKASKYVTSGPARPAKEGPG